MAGVVVGGALVQGGKVLAARRTSPPSLAGRWEFPGGKVERDESEPDALIREIREELSLEVEVLSLLGRVSLGSERELALYLARPVGGCPQPAVDHDCVRWLSPSELSSVTWLDADRLLLDVVRAAMATKRRGP